ncbi:MAG: protein translocase subunit SecF [Eubacteriaceae bacterium]|nr:protein translocase subunit SecF [Eubacteriaceae bacterium]
MLKIDTKNNAKRLLLIAAVFIIAGILGMVIRGFNFGIDFVGGTIAQFEMHRTFETAEIKAVTDRYDKDMIISAAGDGNTQVIIKSTINFDESVKAEIIADFCEAFGITDEDVLSFDIVSPTIGKELRSQALKASVITIICVLLYITVRIEFVSALSSIIALLHDVLIMVGFYAIFHLQVNSSFIAAVLTILGYSINSSIVVFDRIKDETRKHSRSDIVGIVDDSLAKSVKRTVYTTLTTMLAVISLYVFGVTSIREFTLPMIVGFAAGAYSSLFVAPSVWYLMKSRKAK